MHPMHPFCCPLPLLTIPLMRPGFEVSLNESKKASFQYFNQNPLVFFAEDITTGTAVILIGKIYYQNDLKHQFPDLSFSSFPSDAHLILAILQNNDLQALESLEGEFALVAYHPFSNSLIALRDILGNYPLYWLSDGRNLHIGTHLQRLAQAYTQKILNRDFIASFLSFPFAFTELFTEKTIFEGIHRILPGNLLQLSLEKPVQYLRTWNWEKVIHPIEKISLEEAGLRFREIFQQSIQERCQTGVIASHLSGGMDSSSVVCLARELSLEQPLITLSLVYKMPSLAGEIAYIQQILSQNSKINAYLIPADEALDFQWFTPDFPDHDEPYPGLFHLAMEKILCDKASELGITTILSGGGSEFITEGNHYYLADLIHQKQILKALKEAKSWSEAKSQNPWSILFNFGLKPLIPAALWRQGDQRLSKLGEFTIPPWIKPDFIKNYYLDQKIPTLRQQIYHYPFADSFNQLNLRTASGNWASWYLASPVNMQISKPFLDPRLISYCLNLPLILRETPTTTAKPLLQEAMKDILPDSIRTRRYKTSFNEVYWKGLRKNLPYLEEMITQSSFKDFDIFDHSQMLTALQQHSLGLGDVKQGSRLAVALALIAWFENQGGI